MKKEKTKFKSLITENVDELRKKEEVEFNISIAKILGELMKKGKKDRLQGFSFKNRELHMIDEEDKPYIIKY